MSEELGKIEKPPVEEFKEGRKLYLVPLIYCGKEPDEEYLQKFNRYWNQVENQMCELEMKLGAVGGIYHELVAAGGDDGIGMIKALSEKSYQIVDNRLGKGAELEATEDGEVLTEFMDWSRCLATGLQNQKVFIEIYQQYTEAGKKRSEHISGQIDKTLEADEVGVLFITEGHQVQFPPDVQVFYVAPPALDEIQRWLRDHRAESAGE